MSNLTLKNITHSFLRSESSYCFTGDLYRGDEPWCRVENDGHGELSRFQPLNGITFSQLKVEISEFSDSNEEIESVLGILVQQDRRDIELKRLLKQPLAFNPKNNAIHGWKTPIEHNTLKELKSIHTGFIILNDMDFDEARRFYDKAIPI